MTEFHLAAERIVVPGSSADGWLATASATYGSGADRVNGVVALPPAVSSYRAGNGGRYDVGTAKDRKVRDSATILVRCWMSTVHRTESRPGSPTTLFRQDVTS